MALLTERLSADAALNRIFQQLPADHAFGAVLHLLLSVLLNSFLINDGFLLHDQRRNIIDGV